MTMRVYMILCPGEANVRAMYKSPGEDLCILALEDRRCRERYLCRLDRSLYYTTYLIELYSVTYIFPNANTDVLPSCATRRVIR